MQRIGPLKRPGPPVLAVQQAPPEGNDRFVDSPLPHPLLRFEIGSRGPLLFGKPVYAEGSDRALDSPLPGPQRLMVIGARNRLGPPILLRQQGFPAEGSDRFVDSPLTQPLLKFRIGSKPFGPPLLIRQIGAAEGNDRCIAPPLTHPLLKFQIGARRFGPPLLLRQVGYAEGSDAFVDSPLTHPLLRFWIGRHIKAGPPIIPGNQFPMGVSLAFPVQFAGLRTFYSGTVHELCLVAEADAPASMGGVIKILKGATLYAVYLVDTTDPNASSVRVKTATGIKSIRNKT